MNRSHRRAAALIAASLWLFGSAGIANAADPIVSLKWIGWGTDVVGAGDPADYSAWDEPDGRSDGRFAVTIKAPGQTVLSLTLRGGGGTWDTVYANSAWALGVSKGRSPAPTLLNDPSDGTFQALVKTRVGLTVNADDDPGGTPHYFAAGGEFFVDACFEVVGCFASNGVTLP